MFDTVFTGYRRGRTAPMRHRPAATSYSLLSDTWSMVNAREMGENGKKRRKPWQANTIRENANICWRRARRQLSSAGQAYAADHTASS
ncbi:hypothetical protein AB4156_35935 [Cupriavidus sp. 2MCAB6]|uniref:hypothetical protein n=1 Tax=Cupriavidus sp. 2MCAB6 TaxID=3232981 RepID=UPI003F8E3727